MSGDLELAGLQRIRQTLSDCQGKLALYRTQHSGEYIGGVEYITLMKRVAGAIVDVIDLETTPRLEGLRDGVLEEAARVTEGWPTEAAGHQYQTCGNGRFWDEGTLYDQGRTDAAAAIRALKSNTDTETLEALGPK